MIKKRWVTLILILTITGMLSACGANQAQEFIALTDRVSEMDAEWTTLMEEEAALNAASPSFETIDAFYDRAIAKANADIDELNGMIDTLESLKQGINELDYEEFKEVLINTVSTTQVAVDYFSYDRGWAKAKAINDDYHEFAEEWNDLDKSEKTLEVASGYLDRMIELNDTLEIIKDEIDVETYDEMKDNLKSAIEAFNESITALKEEQTETK